MLVAFLLVVVVNPPLTLLLPPLLLPTDAAVANVDVEAETLLIMETNFSINNNAL